MTGFEFKENCISSTHIVIDCSDFKSPSDGESFQSLFGFCLLLETTVTRTTTTATTMAMAMTSDDDGDGDEDEDEHDDDDEDEDEDDDDDNVKGNCNAVDNCCCRVFSVSSVIT